MPLTGRHSAALDRLSEEQGPEGGALAHADQRAARVDGSRVNGRWSPCGPWTERPGLGEGGSGGGGGGVTDVDHGMRLRTSCMTVKDSRPSLLCVNE